MIWTTRPRSDVGALRAIQAGTGPRVLLLHGVGLRAEAWNAQIDALRFDYEIIAPDMAGHGESPRLSGPVSLSAYTDLVAAALDGPAVVIGHSMGAMIALDLATRYPELVRGVVALNAIFQRSPEAKAAVRARADSLDGQTVSDPTTTLQRWFGDTASEQAVACKDWLSKVDPAGYRDAYRVFASEDGPEEAILTALPCPALFCTGALEPNSTPEMSTRMAALTPKGRAEIVAGAAHMMPMTHPTEVNTLLRGFLEEVAQ